MKQLSSLSPEHFRTEHSESRRFQGQQLYALTPQNTMYATIPAYRTRLLIASLFFLVFLHACSSTPPGYTPRSDYVEASWYGPKFNGRPTSSGERFDMYAMTCAHKKFPFGTRLRVTNPDNKRSVVVTVNDRGPFIPGRDLDLSYGAAKKIGLVEKGVGKVRIEHLGRDMRYVKRISFGSSTPAGPLTVQIGSFRDISNALRLKNGLSLNYQNVSVTTAFIKGKKYHRVRVGKFSNRDAAYSLARKLSQEGYSTLITSR